MWWRVAGPDAVKVSVITLRTGHDGLTDANEHACGGSHTVVSLTPRIGMPSILPDRSLSVPTPWAPRGWNVKGSSSEPRSTTKAQLVSGEVGRSTASSNTPFIGAGS